MNEQQIAKALTKLYNSLLIKDRFKFRLEVNPKVHSSNIVVYRIIIYVTVDHAMYWPESPEWDKEYTSFLNNLRDDYEEELDSITKYILHTEQYVIHFKFEHFNTDVYERLLDYLGEKGIPFKIEHDSLMPNLEVVIDENYPEDWDKLMNDIDSHFDIEDIAFYTGDLNK
jgi:hypothetical protein